MSRETLSVGVRLLFFGSPYIRALCRHSCHSCRLVLYVKLFCLMGLTWVTEIISWASGGREYYWYATDAINLLRAVFIFIIFCCKRKVSNAKFHMLT